MRWTERQRAMLREMGVQLWTREKVEEETWATSASAPAATTAPAIAQPTASTTQAIAAAATIDVRAAASAASPPTARERASRFETSASASAPDAALAAADWLVVGEPFDTADPQQEQLLDNMLDAIGLARRASTRERRACYLALVGPADGATPAPARALAAAIETVAPRCIVACGRGAAAALLGSDAPIGNWRGRRHTHAGVPVVVTFALAFLLRHPADKAKAWADLCLAVGARSAGAV